MSIYKSISGERAVKQRYVEVLKRWPVAGEHLLVRPSARARVLVALFRRAEAQVPGQP
jgi:hypothetical protein